MTENECPTCSDTFDTEAGMKRHHAQIHDESIAKSVSTCEVCGCDFEHYDSRKGVVCSNECVGGRISDLWESTDKMVEPPDMTGRELVTGECEVCGGEFEGIPSVVEKRRFCSKECKGEWCSGENHPMWKGGKVAVECEWCGEEYREDPHREERTRWCSEDCAVEALSEMMLGEDHPRWREGAPEYGENWEEQREKVRERDGYSCVRCGVDESEMDRELDVHHITPIREFDGSEEANRLENLVALCRPCHMNVESWGVKPQLSD